MEGVAGGVAGRGLNRAVGFICARLRMLGRGEVDANTLDNCEMQVCGTLNSDFCCLAVQILVSASLLQIIRASTNKGKAVA